jgi:putative DNA primase/helicase
MDARAITKALGGRWCGGYGLARCPSHDDREPSLKVKDDPRKSGGIDLHCFAGCGWQDVKTEFRRQGLLPQFAASTVKPKPISPRPPFENDDAGADDDTIHRLEIALSIWRATTPLKDTLGFKYFTERRGLHIGLLELDHVLRWHNGIRAVVALMTDPTTAEPTGIHRRYLNPDGTKRDPNPLMLGKQGVVRLSPDEDVTQGLGITEGVEDALTVLISGWAPAWAATSAGAITSFPVLAGIEALTIFRDDNEVGVKAAEACAQRWDEAGREVFIASLKELT